MIIPSESEIRRIVEKHLRSISLEVKGSPGLDLQASITEAMRKASPFRGVRESDVQAVVKTLATKQSVDRNLIQETARRIVERSDADDLRTLVAQYLEQLKQPFRKITGQDITSVIDGEGLDAAHSSVSEVKRATQNYLLKPRALRDVPEEELRGWARQELQRYGSRDEREVTRTLNQYVAYSDRSKPFNPKDIADLVQAQKPAALPAQPKLAEPQPSSNVVPGQQVPPKNPRRQSFFERIREKLYRYGIQPLSQQSRNWLQDNIRKAAAPSQDELFRRNKLMGTVTDSFVGQMFFYAYDAKTKNKLPYWDAFPLTIIMELYDDGWLGLNLHYLPISLRVALLGNLLTLADNDSLDKIKRVQISYTYLASFAKSSLAQPCVKRYLADHVASSLLPVEAVDYETAIFLPVEQFQKASKQTVWRNARR